MNMSIQELVKELNDATICAPAVHGRMNQIRRYAEELQSRLQVPEAEDDPGVAYRDVAGDFEIKAHTPAKEREQLLAARIVLLASGAKGETTDETAN